MLVCSSNKHYIGLMEEDLDLDDLVAYDELLQFRPRGSGHFLNKSQRRQIAYGYMVLHLSAREIHNNYFEGATRHPLCTIGRIRDIYILYYLLFVIIVNNNLFIHVFIHVFFYYLLFISDSTGVCTPLLSVSQEILWVHNQLSPEHLPEL